ncbi:DNA-methyltransferase [Georgenia thermotolerans]|uniref:DNA-methyltransferase n=1 Tax=Georgenia thermotolerans TaxID=527326 RepID=UPI0012642740|nr:site-specific DNA-methyltransferase [Georgenia thermotolerans]
MSLFDIFPGDCVEVMRTLPAESVDAVITSPPYAEQRKSTYGGIPEKDYPAWTVAWMREARRLLKPDGSVIINISPHINKGQLSDYVLRTRLALRQDGWNECDELIWHKTNAMPVGPNNRPRRSWESLLWYSKTPKCYTDPTANGAAPLRATAVVTSGQHVKQGGFDHYTDGGNKNTTPKVARSQNVVAMSKGSETTGHPAPFPWQLAEWCGRLICPPGGTVLDPFNGSGSTGVAALRNGWDYIGIEKVPEYVAMSKRRLAAIEDAA